MSGQNVHSMHHMLPPGELQWVCRWGTQRQMDRRRTITLPFPLNVANVVSCGVTAIVRVTLNDASLPRWITTEKWHCVKLLYSHDLRIIRCGFCLNMYTFRVVHELSSSVTILLIILLQLRLPWQLTSFP